MEDKGEKFGLVRGFLLAYHAPAEVLEALEGVGRLVEQVDDPSLRELKIELPDPPRFDAKPATGRTIETRQGERRSRIVTHSEVACMPRSDDMPPSEEAGRGERPEKKKPHWSPEARAAAAERMRKRNASKSQQGGAKHSWGYSGARSDVTESYGQAETAVDEHGRTVTKLPPGYAFGVRPDPSAGSKSGY